MKKSNIAVLSVFLLVVFAVVFTACGKATPDSNYNYRKNKYILTLIKKVI